MAVSPSVWAKYSTCNTDGISLWRVIVHMAHTCRTKVFNAELTWRFLHQHLRCCPLAALLFRFFRLRLARWRAMLNQLPRRDIIMTGGMMVREERDTPSAISSRQLTLASAALKSSDCRLHLLVCWISRLLFYCRCMALAVRPRDHTTGISPPTDHSYFATRLLCAAARWFGRRTDDVLRRCVWLSSIAMQSVRRLMVRI